MYLEIGCREHDPVGIVLPVRHVIENQRSYDFQWDHLWRDRTQLFQILQRQLTFRILQWSQLQRIGDNIIEAQCPGPFGILRKQRHLKLNHLIPPCGVKTFFYDLCLWDDSLTHLIWIVQHKAYKAMDMAVEPAAAVRTNQLGKTFVQFFKMALIRPRLLGRGFFAVRNTAPGTQHLVYIVHRLHHGTYTHER